MPPRAAAPPQLSPFHLAIPVHSLSEARAFYGGVLGLEEGRSSSSWVDYSLHGHQVVAHLVSSAYRGQDHFNPVDRDYVPVPHFGLCLSVPEFRELVARLKARRVEFLVEPHLRFQGQPGEQWTMFFKDPRCAGPALGGAWRRVAARALTPAATTTSSSRP